MTNTLIPDIDAETTAKIIKSVVLALDQKTYEVAEAIGINRQQMYDYTMAKKMPRYVFWATLKAKFPNVSGDFLLTGKGPVLLD